MDFEWSDVCKWQDKTREERQFCAGLYNEIRRCPGRFVALLNSCEIHRDAMPTLKQSEFVDVGFEVAFYRDITKMGFKTFTDDCVKRQRKFDLALFFERHLIVIEAEAQQSFGKSDIENLERDQTLLGDRLRGVTTCFVGLCSSKYWDSARRSHAIEDRLNLALTWAYLDRKYPYRNFD